jgi:hypothetical protein
MFRFKITPDRHNAIQKLNYCVLPHPAHFSLPSTFKAGISLGIERWFIIEATQFIFQKILLYLVSCAIITRLFKNGLTDDNVQCLEFNMINCQTFQILKLKYPQLKMFSLRINPQHYKTIEYEHEITARLD